LADKVKKKEGKGVKGKTSARKGRGQCTLFSKARNGRKRRG